MIMFSHFKIVFLCFARNPFDDGLKVPICEIGLCRRQKVTYAFTLSSYNNVIDILKNKKNSLSQISLFLFKDVSWPIIHHL